MSTWLTKCKGGGGSFICWRQGQLYASLKHAECASIVFRLYKSSTKKIGLACYGYCAPLPHSMRISVFYNIYIIFVQPSPRLWRVLHNATRPAGGFILGPFNSVHPINNRLISYILKYLVDTGRPPWFSIKNWIMVKWQWLSFFYPLELSSTLCGLELHPYRCWFLETGISILYSVDLYKKQCKVQVFKLHWLISQEFSCNPARCRASWNSCLNSPTAEEFK